MKVIEAYCQATTSSNLQDDQFHHATEKLAAVALSGALGSWLFRVKYSNDASSYHRLLADWTEEVIKKSVRRKWPKEVSPQKIARLSLDYWLNDGCTVCGGKGHVPLTKVPRVLSDFDCKACNGTAKRPIVAKHNLINYIADMVEELNTMTIRAGGEAMRKLAKEMEL